MCIRDSNDGGVHQGVPYWLNGFLPLAYQLENETLINMAFKYIDYILSHQAEDGWLGPDDIRDGNAYWSQIPMMLSLRQVNSEGCVNTAWGTPYHKRSW